MNIIEFGTALIKSRDLDPVYCAIYDSMLEPENVSRLVLAYSCLYHLGAASRIAEQRGKRFWELLHAAAVNDGLKWPRGSERRHWRGGQAVRSAEYLESNFKIPEHAVEYWLKPSGTDNGSTFAEVSKRVQTCTGFGPWIAFKIADMGERVLVRSVDFSGCELGIYKDPRQGAAVAFAEMQQAGEEYNSTLSFQERPWEYPIADEELRATVAYYVRQFSKLKAPPSRDRKINVQEVETVFCKYKSHLKGHYPTGKDSREVRHQLEGWGDLAQQLQRNVPIYREAESVSWPGSEMG